MGHAGKMEDETIHGARITQLDVIDDSCVMVTFSNGTSARVASDDVKRLNLERAEEIITTSDHED